VEFVLILVIVLLAGALLAPAVLGRREISLYGSIVEFNRRLSNIALLRTAAPSITISPSAIWDEPSVIGTPPPTVRLIGPDGKPVDTPLDNAPGSGGRTVAPSGQPSSVTRPPLSGLHKSPDLYTPPVSNASRPLAGSPSYDTLRRRKLIFQTLLGAFGATFVVGLLPGLRAVLLLSIFCGVLLGAYIVLLRKIKLQSSVALTEPQTGPSG
jgi:hypothetical protein